MTELDRDSLARRNRLLAAAIHRPTRRQKLRDLCLAALAKAPLKAAGDPNRLLAIVPDHLGDALLATPALTWIKRCQPDLRLHVLCSPANADMFQHFAEIDAIQTLDFPGFQRGAGESKNALSLALTEAKTLRRDEYGSALIMRPDHWWGAMIAHLAGIPDRVGYANSGVAPFMTRSLDFTHEHALTRNMRLASAWLNQDMPVTAKLELPLRPGAENEAEMRLAACGIAAQTAIICLHPGAGAKSKLWQPDKMAAVADALADAYNAAIVLTGTAGEVSMLNHIASMTQNSQPIIVSDASIGELAALYQRARLALGPDSGVMHLAAAVGTPTVTLFGPADPLEFAPWGDASRHAVITSSMACAPCRVLDWRSDDPALHPCVRDISVDHTLEAARRVLNEVANAW